MKHEAKASFQAADRAAPGLPMMEAISTAREAILAMTGLGADSIAQCQREPDGGWRICVDVIESPARMGDNDLLATYELLIGSDASLQSYARLRRYHREDGDA